MPLAVRLEVLVAAVLCMWGAVPLASAQSLCTCTILCGGSSAVHLTALHKNQPLRNHSCQATLAVAKLLAAPR